MPHSTTRRNSMLQQVLIKPGSRHDTRVASSKSSVAAGVLLATVIFSTALLAVPSDAAFAPNHFLGTCLDDDWVASMNIANQERDSLGRLLYPFLQPALKFPRYQVRVSNAMLIALAHFPENALTVCCFSLTILAQRQPACMQMSASRTVLTFMALAQKSMETER